MPGMAERLLLCPGSNSSPKDGDGFDIRGHKSPSRCLVLWVQVVKPKPSSVGLRV